VTDGSDLQCKQAHSHALNAPGEIIIACKVAIYNREVTADALMLASSASTDNIMRQHSWDAVLLGAVTLIAVVNGVLADQTVTAVTPHTTPQSARAVRYDAMIEVEAKSAGVEPTCETEVEARLRVRVMERPRAGFNLSFGHPCSLERPH